LSAGGPGSAAPSGLSRLASPAVGAVAVFAITFGFQLPFFDRWFSTMDEGHLLAFADIVAKGGHMYRDATIYPLPGAFYMLALAFKAFGASIILSRWIVMLEFSLFVVLSFLLIRRVVPAYFAWGGVVVMLLYRVWVFPHWQIYSYSTTSLLFLAGCMLAMLSFFDDAGAGRSRGEGGGEGEDEGQRERLWKLALSGFLFGMAVLCKQDYGAAMLIAALATLVVYARAVPASRRTSLPRLLGWFIVPGALVGAAMTAYFAYHGIFGDLFQQTVLGHVRGLATFEYPEIPELLPLLGQDERLRSSEGIFVYWPGIIFTVDLEALRSSFLYRETSIYDILLKLFYYAPHLIVLGGGLRLILRRGALAEPEARRAYLCELLVYAFGFGIFLVLTLNKPQDYLHFAVAYWPYLFLAVIYVHALLEGRRALALALALVTAVPAAAAVGYSARLAGRLRTTNTDLIPGERAGIYAKPAEARMIENVVAYARANSEPGEIVSVIPYFPIVQFLMDRPGPHRSSYIVWPFPEFADRDERIVRAMEEKQVELVIYNFTQFVNFPLMSEFSPRLFSYVVDNYVMDEVFSYDYSGYKLAGLKRTREAPPGRPLTPDLAAAGALRVEPEMGPARPVAPGERSEFLAEQLWPFRPVMALRPTDDGGRSVFALEIDVPSGARLQTAVGTNPGAWFDHPSYSSSFGIAVVGEDGSRKELYARELKPQTVFEDRGWFPVDVSLADFAGRRVTLEFSTATQLPPGEWLLGGGWERPRLVVEESPADPTS
jgi:hypothetical protein